MAPVPLKNVLPALQSGSEERRALAASGTAPPEVLMLLATDVAVVVRAAVANNPAAPPHADRLLAQDADVPIRTTLARKLGARAPELMAEDAPRRLRLAREALLLLAQDVVAQVRAALADTLADMPDAPRALVLSLAQDLALEVCEPLIRLSGVLTDPDLLALVAAPPNPHTRAAVARRLFLRATVGDAVLASADAAAIAALLRNASAAITPEALTRLALQVRAMPWLREPLASRLPPGALAAVATRPTPPVRGATARPVSWSSR